MEMREAFKKVVVRANASHRTGTQGYLTIRRPHALRRESFRWGTTVDRGPHAGSTWAWGRLTANGNERRRLHAFSGLAVSWGRGWRGGVDRGAAAYR